MMQSDWEFRAQEMEEDEVAALMSMALDGQLAGADDAQFASLLADDPALEQEWQVWRKLDAELRSAPAMEPPAGFVAEFEQRLARAEGRRKLWTGIGASAAAVLLWCLFVAGVAGAGAYLLLWQTNLVSETLSSLTYWLAVGASWVQSALALAGALLATPQAMAIVCGYVLAATGILWAWVLFLRRSVRGADVAVLN
jgi:anti-sigma factor RsiW